MKVMYDYLVLHGCWVFLAVFSMLDLYKSSFKYPALYSTIIIQQLEEFAHFMAMKDVSI